MYGPHAHSVVAYKERIREAICGDSDKPGHVWDKPAAALLYAWNQATGNDGNGYASLSDHDKKLHRETAFAFADWIAEQLGQTVLDAKREYFQDDERVLLDIGPAPQKTEPKRHKAVSSRAFVQSLADAGIISNPEWTSRVTIVAEGNDYIRITQEILGDERLLDQVANTETSTWRSDEPTPEQVQAYLENNPDRCNSALKTYLRIHNLTGVRRGSR